jgi:N12 class adenine-specific DNA methylase
VSRLLEPPEGRKVFRLTFEPKPGDIDANLGAPWISETDIQAFAAHLFGVEPKCVRVGHLVRDAVWSLDYD